MENKYERMQENKRMKKDEEQDAIFEYAKSKYAISTLTVNSTSKRRGSNIMIAYKVTTPFADVLNVLNNLCIFIYKSNSILDWNLLQGRLLKQDYVAGYRKQQILWQVLPSICFLFSCE